MTVFILIGFLLLMYLFPASLAMSVTRWAKEPEVKVRRVRDKAGNYRNKSVKVQPNLTLGESVKCCIPIMSACQVWNALYWSYGWTKYVAIVIPIGIVFRILVVFLTTNELLFIISFYVLWVCLILHQLLYTIVYIVTARMHECGIFTQILCLVFPEFAAYLLVSKVPRVMKELREEESTITE